MGLWPVTNVGAGGWQAVIAGLDPVIGRGRSPADPSDSVREKHWMTPARSALCATSVAGG